MEENYRQKEEGELWQRETQEKTEILAWLKISGETRWAFLNFVNYNCCFSHAFIFNTTQEWKYFEDLQHERYAKWTVEINK